MNNLVPKQFTHEAKYLQRLLNREHIHSKDDNGNESISNHNRLASKLKLKHNVDICFEYVQNTNRIGTHKVRWLDFSDTENIKRAKITLELLLHRSIKLYGAKQ